MSRTQFPCLAGRINQIAASERCQPPLLQPSCDDGKAHIHKSMNSPNLLKRQGCEPCLLHRQMLIAGETKTTTLVAPQQHPSPFILLIKQQRNTDRFLTYTTDGQNISPPVGEEERKYALSKEPPGHYG
uniref:Uncharacterized protein n=1 Tax=Globodera rostochiensis TaxID=31243 RepID=A0A914HZI2_GLORO